MSLSENRVRVLCVFGTRPEAIKMAPVVQALADSDTVESKVCVTAQHRHMLDQVLNLFGITPDFDLDLMKHDQDLTDITTCVLHGMRSVFKSWRPDWVFVHGDTATTLATSIAAYYEKISVGHVEAGLRTGNIYSPWPEEVNRRVAGVISTLHFAPTITSKNNLIREGVPDGMVHVTGNTVIDALLKIVNRLDDDVDLADEMEQRFGFLDKTKKLILVTGHRRENFGRSFENIYKALHQISQRDDVEIVYPVHLNPNVQAPVKRILGENPGVHLIEPIDYLPFIYLMRRAYIVLTDSGGIQEEAPSLGKPVLVMRETTERPEAVDAGTVKLVGAKPELIVSETMRLIDNVSLYEDMSLSHNPYGDGDAANSIVNALMTHVEADSS